MRIIKEYLKPNKLTIAEEQNIKTIERGNLGKEWNWIARDKNGNLFVFEKKPVKSIMCWMDNSEDRGSMFLVYPEHRYGNFDDIKWEDEEPTRLEPDKLQEAKLIDFDEAKKKCQAIIDEINKFYLPEGSGKLVLDTENFEDADTGYSVTGNKTWVPAKLEGVIGEMEVKDNLPSDANEYDINNYDIDDSAFRDGLESLDNKVKAVAAKLPIKLHEPGNENLQVIEFFTADYDDDEAYEVDEILSLESENDDIGIRDYPVHNYLSAVAKIKFKGNLFIGLRVEELE